MILRKVITISLFAFFIFEHTHAQIKKDKQNVDAEHGMINVNESANKANQHTVPGTEWFPNAGLGLFIHWGISSVKNISLSWAMIPGRELNNQKLGDAEIADIIAKKDYNRFNDWAFLTPNDYWKMAKDFRPENFHPEKWIKAAKEAGFKYVVFTAKHHDGFALWPSKYGNFNTKNYMGGKDFVKKFVEACRKHGLKVGLYYSPPDWYFDKEYMNFIHWSVPKAQPKFPKLDTNLEPRTSEKSEEEKQKHYKAFRIYERGQLTELLSNYGKIDLLWFDGRATIPNADKLMTREEIHKLQPGIVINPRMHGTGDYITFERTPPTKAPNTWAEFCNTWTTKWTHSDEPFRSNAFILGQLALCRSLAVNYLLGVGPDRDGKMSPDVYKNLDVVESWMKINGESVKDVQPLPQNEVANVIATAKGNNRYLFAIPSFKKDSGNYPEDMLPLTEVLLTFKGGKKPEKVLLLGKNTPLKYTYHNQLLKIEVPVTLRTKLVDVVKIVY